MPTLRELLERITDDNIHPYVDFGPPVGKERFWEFEDEPAGAESVADELPTDPAAQPASPDFPPA